MGTVARNITTTALWPKGPGLSASTSRKYRRQQAGFKRTPFSSAPMAYQSWMEDASGNIPPLNPFNGTYYMWLSDAPNEYISYDCQQEMTNRTGGVAAAINRCYADFRETVYSGTSAGLGETLGEGREAIQMIVTRVSGLTNALRHLKMGLYKQAAEDLGLVGLTKPTDQQWNGKYQKTYQKIVNSPRFTKGMERQLKRKYGTPDRRNNSDYRTGWSGPKDLSSLWLEYWLGWAPMIADIQNALKVLTAPLPKWTYRGKGGSRRSRTIKVSNADYKGEISYTSKYGCRMQADVQIINPNEVFADRLGIINPWSVGFALAPLSFLVDWFINISDVLNSMTDFAGMAFTNACTSIRVKGKQTGLIVGNNASYKGLTMRRDCEIAYLKRETSIAVPILTATIPLRLSISRAATAISVLVATSTKG